MPRIALAPEMLDDFDRFFEHQASFGISDTADRLADIVSALQVSTQSPLIGRKVRRGKRELVIGRGSRGCVALYRHVPQQDAVLVLALRSQREAGYKRNSGSSTE